MSRDHTEGGWALHSTDLEWEGLCQLSNDVMIYFEEMMSGLCSEASDYSGYRWIALISQLPAEPAAIQQVLIWMDIIFTGQKEMWMYVKYDLCWSWKLKAFTADSGG